MRSWHVQDDYSGDAGAAEEQDERKVVHIDPTFNSNPPAGPTPSHQTAAGMATGAAMPLQVGERSPEQVCAIMGKCYASTTAMQAVSLDKTWACLVGNLNKCWQASRQLVNQGHPCSTMLS